MCERCGITRTALALLLAAGALLAVVGCSRGLTAPVATDAPDAAEQTSSVAATSASDVTSATTGGSPDSAAGSSSGLSAEDASALDAELSAIQSELDRLSVPSDSDFDSIGSGLE